MTSKPAVPPASPPHPRDTPFESERDQISRNIEAVLEFYTREEQKIGRWQRLLERIGGFIGQPVFLGVILLFAALDERGEPDQRLKPAGEAKEDAGGDR